MKVIFPIGLVACLCLSCKGNGPAAPPPAPSFLLRPAYPWPQESLARAGVDSLLIADAISQLKDSSTAESFVLVRNDSLVAEYYKPGLSAESDEDIRSASKSFISCLVGIALDKGFLDSLNEPVLRFFPEFDTTGMDPRKRLITIEHLLTMRAGFVYDESKDYSSIYTESAQWPLVTLGLPLRAEPGSEFNYATPLVHLLSAILTRATGMSTYNFAEQYLFTPLNISVRSWYQDPHGIFLGGTGMSFAARDLARFGSLYLHHGEAGGVSIVPDSWIQQSLVPRNPSDDAWGSLSALNYGFLWWVNNGTPDSLYYAGGYAGQFIFVVPDRHLVGVFTSNILVSSSQAGANELFLVNLFSSRILPAIPVVP